MAWFCKMAYLKDACALKKRARVSQRRCDGLRDRAGMYKVQEFRQPVCNKPS